MALVREPLDRAVLVNDPGSMAFVRDPPTLLPAYPGYEAPAGPV